jgi:predicted nuclease of predicted toxin-antitoxin system
MDLGLHAGPDTEVWDHALANGFVILTKDEDFP